MEDNKIYNISNPKEKLTDILNDYFSINDDTYYYKLTRIKSSPFVSLDDFEELDEYNIEDLVNYIIENFEKDGD